MVMILPTGGIFNCDTAEKIQTKGFLLNQLLMVFTLLFILVTLPLLYPPDPPPTHHFPDILSGDPCPKDSIS